MEQKIMEIVIPTTPDLSSMQPPVSDDSVSAISIITNSVECKASKRFSEYIISKGEKLNLDTFLARISAGDADAKNRLKSYLCTFFSDLRKEDGTWYKQNSLKGIRYGLYRYILQIGTDIVNDPYFQDSNNAWQKYYTSFNVRKAITRSDLKMAYDWCNSDLNDPDKLQKRVFMDIVLYFGGDGYRNLSTMTADDFQIKTDIETGIRFIVQTSDVSSAGVTSFARMLEMNVKMLRESPDGEPYCPVAVFEKLVSKLHPQSRFLFCHLMMGASNASRSQIWYTHKPHGNKVIVNYMRDISRKADLSSIYTNQCLLYTLSDFVEREERSERESILKLLAQNPTCSNLPTKKTILTPTTNLESKMLPHEEKGFHQLDQGTVFIHRNTHFVGGNGPTREHPDPLPVRPMNMLQSTAGYAEAGPSNQGYSGKPENSRRKKIATATVSSETVLIPDDSPPQPTAPKLQKKQLDDRRFDERRFDEQRFQERRFENRRFEERRQMAAAQSAQVAAPSLQVPSQMQVQQHLQVSAPPPAPVQTAPRQVQVLAPPVQVTVAKPKPVEKPRPREKRIFVVADHQRCVMSNLASLWKSGKLCDAGIGNGSSTVMVHKVVLSAVCPKLLSVFSTDILSHKFLQVNFPEEVSTEALNAFAEYMYNGILDLDRDILEQLKIIAKRLDMKEFEQLCDSHLPNHMHQTASAAVASFSNVPLIQTTMPIPPMTSSLPSLGSTISTSMHSAPSITTQVIDVKQEISEAELAQVKKDTAAVFGQESEVSSLAPNKSGNAAGFVISPSIKTEPVGPEDDKYGHLSSSSSNQAFTSTASSSSVIPTAASTSIASVPASSTEFAIPFSEATDVKSTRLKVTHSYDPPLVSDLSPVSCIVETVCSQSSPMNEDSSKPLNRLAVSTTSDGLSTSTGNEAVYPVGLFTAGGDNLPLLTTQTVGVKTIDLYKTDLT